MAISELEPRSLSSNEGQDLKIEGAEKGNHGPDENLDDQLINQESAPTDPEGINEALVSEDLGNEYLEIYGTKPTSDTKTEILKNCRELKAKKQKDKLDG